MAKTWLSDPKTLLLTGVSAAAGAVIAWYFISRGEDIGARAATAPPPAAMAADCSYRLDRIGSYRYTHPLYQAEQDCEAAGLLPLKAEITKHIDEAVTSGSIASASVYLRAFGRGQWMTVHNGSSFDLFDLSRLPIMISWMKAYQDGVRANTLLPWPSPTIRNLDSLLLAAADMADTATIAAMARQLSPQQRETMFQEIGLHAPPDWNAGTSTAHDFGAFLKVLFNATLLGPEDSDRILGALERNKNASLMGTFLPPSIAVCGVHTERTIDGRLHLHEAGVIMEDHGPYLLVVMTEANEPAAARELVRWILERANARMRGGALSAVLLPTRVG